MTQKQIRKERKLIELEIEKQKCLSNKIYDKLYKLYSKCKHPDKRESPPTTDSKKIYECQDCGALGSDEWFRRSSRSK